MNTGVQYSEHLKILLALARRLSEQSSEHNESAEPFEYSFTTLMAAFLVAPDPLSQWFRRYVRRARIQVDELLAKRGLNRLALQVTRQSIRSAPGAPTEQSPVEYNLQPTGSAFSIMNNAQLLLNATNDKTNILDVRHVMGAYIFRSEGGHKTDLWRLGFKSEHWADSFLDWIDRFTSEDEKAAWTAIDSRELPLIVPVESLSESNFASSTLDIIERARVRASKAQPRAIPLSTSGLMYNLLISKPTPVLENFSLLKQFTSPDARTRLENWQRQYYTTNSWEGFQFDTQPEKMTRYVSRAFEDARLLIERSGSNSENIKMIEPHHLLAALLFYDTAQPSSYGAQALLLDVGVNLHTVREQFLNDLRVIAEDDANSLKTMLPLEPAIPLTKIDPDLATGEQDFLDIDPQVDALAGLIASHETDPPLAIGIFGDWGSGKTFFMRRVQKKIVYLAERSRASGPQHENPFYQNIVQIEFNAWHYVEGNIWASLVEHIFSHLQLAQHPDASPSDTRQYLLKQIEFEKAMRQQAEIDIALARRKLSVADAELARVQAIQEHNRIRLEKVNLRSIRNLLRLYPGALSDSIQEFKKKINLVMAFRAAQDLQVVINEVELEWQQTNAGLTELEISLKKLGEQINALDKAQTSPAPAFRTALVAIQEELPRLRRVLETFLPEDIFPNSDTSPDLTVSRSKKVTKALKTIETSLGQPPEAGSTEEASGDSLKKILDHLKDDYESCKTFVKGAISSLQTALDTTINALDTINPRPTLDTLEELTPLLGGLLDSERQSRNTTRTVSQDDRQATLTVAKNLVTSTQEFKDKLDKCVLIDPSELTKGIQQLNIGLDDLHALILRTRVDEAGILQSAQELVQRLPGVKNILPDDEAASPELLAAFIDLKTTGRNIGILLAPMRSTDTLKRWGGLVGLALVAGVIVVMVVVAQRIWHINANLEVIPYLLGVVVTSITWIRNQSDSVAEWVAEAAKLRQDIENTLTEGEIEQTREIAILQQDIEKRQLELKSAQERRDQAQQRVDDIHLELEELRPERILAKFIQDRAGSDDYRHYLGVPALIRRDFEKLSERIEEQNKSLLTGALDVDDPPVVNPQDVKVNRIILYIDDLDRCPPERVVAVLQAIHLLLTFKLFVVIVCVDARWVSRSLQMQYPQLLYQSDAEDNSQTRLEAQFMAEANPDWHVVGREASPHDYLEKIFQIPIWLRRLQNSETMGLLGGLVKPVPRPPELSPSRSEDTVQIDGNQPDVGTTLLGNGENPPSVEEQTTENSTSLVAQVNPQALNIYTDELRFMNELAPIMKRSPRAVKRFVNTYRLYKATLDEDDLLDFLNLTAEPPKYHVIQFFLAIITSMPSISTPIFKGIDNPARFTTLVNQQLKQEYLRRIHRIQQQQNKNGDNQQQDKVNPVTVDELQQFDEPTNLKQLLEMLCKILKTDEEHRNLTGLKTWIDTHTTYNFALNKELDATADEVARYSFRVEQT